MTLIVQRQAILTYEVHPKQHTTTKRREDAEGIDLRERPYIDSSGYFTNYIDSRLICSHESAFTGVPLNRDTRWYQVLTNQVW